MSYIRYIYSQMYKNYREGGSLVKPLFFDFPSDDMCFEDIEHTYMLGDAVKVSPVLEAGVNETYKAYFPAGRWADLNDYTQMVDSKGDHFDLKQSLYQTNIHLKEGNIIPFQKNVGPFKTTKELETNSKVSFLVMRD